ncbi:hypothetical protein HDZ31DRAFT_50954, partial [Schizophyllum fasciatum]
QDALRAAARHFGGRTSAFALQTRDIDVCEGSFMEISQESWHLVKPELKTLRVVASDSDSTIPKVTASTAHQPPQDAVIPPTASTSGPLDAKNIGIYIMDGDGWEMSFRVKSTAKLGTAMRVAAAKYPSQADDSLYGYAYGYGYTDGCTGNFKFVFNGHAIGPEDTAASLSMEDGDCIDMHRVQLGGKPVIYLYAPRAIEATVRLSLVPEWAFSAVYPVVPVYETKAGQELEWRVRTQQDGTLHELSTGLDAAYLYWEAETKGARAPSPPPSPKLAMRQASTKEIFRPALSGLADEDSVVLLVSSVTPYLDSTLAAMGLHTEARTSFITYWLPSMLKHKHVALRFVEQAAYERAAPLVVSPAPDVVTRIFMLFKGVSEEELPGWSSAQLRAHEPATRWTDVVGVQQDSTLNAGLFRVIEWGGMEVLH